MRTLQSPFGSPAASSAPTSIQNLEARVRLQKAALLQAQSDLDAAYARAGLQPGPRQYPQVVSDPVSLAQGIIAAGKKRRNEA